MDALTATYIPWDVLLTFSALALALAVAPGPDNIFVLTQSALYGRSAGLVTALGMTSGLFVHITAVALGVAVIFKTSETAFLALKIIGALYLFYLAWKSFHATALNTSGQGRPFMGYPALFRRGIIMNVTNPKVTLFVLALLPQFADPAWGLVSLQVFYLGMIMQAATVLVFGGVAILGGTLAPWVNKSARTQVIIHRAAGCVFAGLAVFLLMAQRS